MKIYRQGDVMIMSTTNAPKAGAKVPRENGKIVLAHGEVTGHSHAIAAPERDATLYETPEQADAALALGTRILKTKKPVTIRHEEHSPITIPAGNYLVRIQREYNPGALRNVAD